MFPLKNTEAYIHANGYRSTLGKELAARDAEISELGSEIQALTNYVADTGVKNLLDNSVKDIGTFSGVTVSQDSKGRFILNGTATANDSIRCGTVTLPAGNYSFNGMKQSGSSSTFFLNIAPKWDGTTNYNLETTDDYSGTTAGELTFIVRIYFRSGVTFNNTVFEPMIRDASITDPTFQPYAKTNVELTQDVANSYVLKGMETKTVTGDGVKTYKQLIEELRDTVNSYVTALGSDYYIITRTIEIYSIQYDAALPKLSKILYDCKYKGFYFDGANNAHIRECFPSTGTTTYLKDLTFNTSPTISINDMTSNVLDNGASIIANFEVYKKV